jgi:hypothetical protein
MTLTDGNAPAPAPAPAAEVAPAPAPAPAAEVTPDDLTPQQVSEAEDVALGDAYDRAMGNTTEPGRDAQGRFQAKDPAPGDDPAPVPAAGTEDATTNQPKTEPTPAPKAGDAPAPGADPAADVEAPSYLPQEVRDAWKDIPATARDALARSQQDMSARLADMGRRAKGFEPIQEVVTRAAQEFPELMNMTPDKIAQDAFTMMQTRAQLMRDPVNTLIQVAQQSGALEALAQRLGGQGQQSVTNEPQPPQTVATAGLEADLRGQIQALTQQVQNITNPAAIDSAVSNAIQERDTQTQITDFAATKEHWAAVETDIPHFIPAAQNIKGPGASHTDILGAAYDMAINARGLMAPAPAPAKADPAPAPKRTEAVIKAKSVTLNSGEGKDAPISEMEALGNAYDRAMAK